MELWHKKKFYHGTQIAIHVTDKPYLDPIYGKGGDEGDPNRAHVFVTPNKFWAQLFALKSDNQISCGTSGRDGKPTIVYLGEPKGA